MRRQFSSGRWRDLRPWERAIVVVVAATIVCFGGAVVGHVAFSARHRTDLGVFLTAARAIREGRDVYQVDWHADHYLFPPLLAIALAPTLPRRGDPATIGFTLTVAVTYVLSVAALLAAVHILASLLEQMVLRPLTGAAANRRWWALRATPIVVMLHSLGRDLQLGQLEEFLLLALCCSLVATLNKRSFRGGLWLSIPICIKVFPAFLLIWPAARRDLRFIAGAIAGCIVGVVIVPTIALGPQRAWAYGREYVETVLLQGVQRGAVAFQSGGTLSMKDVHNFSLLGVFHDLQYFGQADVPAAPSPRTRAAAMSVGLALLLLTLLPALLPRRGALNAADQLILFGQLIALALLIAPVFQSYYLPLLIPLVAGLTAAGMNRRPAGAIYPDRRTLLLFAGFMVINTAVSVKGLEPLRDAGLPTLTVLALWTAGSAALWRRTAPARKPAARDFTLSHPSPAGTV
ncbi:MAG TPA: glycosyltransferase family 87 protein [Tepidisphaeraceae bacterium]|nr:glycosyltransferase family 87 protein [Tepidisphaeraceae bacterium]